MNSNVKEIDKEYSESEGVQHHKGEDKKDVKLPFDMRNFWKNTNEKFFRKIDLADINEVNHLVYQNSKYGKLAFKIITQLDITSDNIFTKIGFPRTLNCLIGKPQEMIIKKNNPSLSSKLFGMYVYVDKYDYAINNLNNEEIDEEIDQLNEKLTDIEKNNIDFFKFLQQKVVEEENRLELPTSVDLTSDEVVLNRFENLTSQIFTLQMKQFSESICNIKKDVKKNKYVLLFDQSEGIDPLTLDEKDYKELLKYRDPMNSISVYDLFQEKIHLYYSTTQSGKCTKIGKLDKNSKKKRGRKQNPDKKIFLDKEKMIKKPKKEEIEIAKIISVNYNFCHHCKQRKPEEVMIKCNSAHCGKFLEKPMKTYYVNNTTVVRKYKNFIITNYTGDPKEILDGYLNKKIPQACERFFCNFCLKGSYDQMIDQIKFKKDWICPWCMGVCFCSRCTRNDQILKLISLYISYQGDINILYDDLITRSMIIDKLSAKLLLSNIIIIKNDPISKSNKLIKTYTGKKDYEQIEEIVEQSYEYKDQLEKLKKYFDYHFEEAKRKKVILEMDKKLTKDCLDGKLILKFLANIAISNNLLNKKKKREECAKDKIIDIVYSHLHESNKIRSPIRPGRIKRIKKQIRI